MRVWAGKKTKAGIHWATRPWRLVGTVLFIIGIPSLWEELGRWRGWIGDGITWVTERAAPNIILPAIQWPSLMIPEFWWPYVTIGLGLLVFNGDRVWHFSRWVVGRVRFKVAEALNQEHFISRDAAARIVADSQWGQTRRDMSEKPQTWDDAIRSHLTMGRDPRRDVKAGMFHGWCCLVLDSFEEQENDAVRIVNNKKQYDEVRLKRWLETRYRGDLIAEFGQP